MNASCSLFSRIGMLLLGTLLSFNIAAQNTATQSDSTELQAALNNPSRSDADKARDSQRKPVQVLSFFGIGKGMTVMDLMASGGWYTEVLSHAVGTSGKVYAQNIQVFLNYNDRMYDKALTDRLANNRLPNVIRWDREFADLGEANSIDAALTALNFHDLYNTNPAWAAEMLAGVKKVLKPGGTLAVIDQNGVAGADNNQLHRITQQEVVDAVTAAGFELIATSELLRNSEDDHTLNVFAPPIRGKTDRIIMKFRKP